jgi:hypothetical protein
MNPSKGTEQFVTQATAEGASTVKLKTRGYGRLASVDLRDHLHLLGMPRRMSSLTKRIWRALPALDQGDTPQCVAFAATQLLTAGPVKNRRKDHDPTLTWTHDFYHRCQQNDEWPGEDYDGTSVRAAMKVLQADGYIGEYLWAFEMPPIINHVLTVGPVDCGTIWTSDMESIDGSGFIRATGDIAGSHSFILRGVSTRKWCPDKTRGAFLVRNSWSPDWGIKGDAWISFADFAKLLHEDGEAATAMEILKDAA